MIQTQVQRKHLYTPLRYPGGKTSLFRFFGEIIERHAWSNVRYIEPYAGGAGSALSLLITGKVSSIVINDYDPTIFCFWQSILKHPKDFIRKIQHTPITIQQWKIQKAIYTKRDASKPFELGFSTFFLNRTNRSGILNAGPIGGNAQTGEWKIDARYNKERLMQKINLLASYKDRITVHNMDGMEIFKKYLTDSNSLFYLDPPYYAKSSKLYLNAFNEENHEDLALILNKNNNAKWVLTYDSVPEIRQLYCRRHSAPFDLIYSAHHSTKTGSEIMIFSDALDASMLYS